MAAMLSALAIPVPQSLWGTQCCQVECHGAPPIAMASSFLALGERSISCRRYKARRPGETKYNVTVTWKLTIAPMHVTMRAIARSRTSIYRLSKRPSCSLFMTHFRRAVWSTQLPCALEEAVGWPTASTFEAASLFVCGGVALF